jgi:cellulose 1,4-beta-cellobiosidase
MLFLFCTSPYLSVFLIKMRYFLGVAALAALAAAAPTETVKEERNPIEARAACSTAVKLAAGSNPFTGRTLHANSAYASEISTAMASVTDTGIQSQGAAVAKVGTFLWL